MATQPRNNYPLIGKADSRRFRQLTLVGIIAKVNYRISFTATPDGGRNYSTNMNEDSQNQEKQSQLSTPSELEGKGIAGVSRKSESADTHDSPTRASDTAKSHASGLSEFASNTHQYIREHISIADKKAAFVLTIAAGLLIYLYETDATSLWLQYPSQWSIVDFFSFLSMWGMAITCVLCIGVVYPRLDGSRRGHVFWNGIREFDSASDYVDSVTRLSDSNVIEEVIKHSYELAGICQTKYKILNWALTTGAIGGVATITLVLFR